MINYFGMIEFLNGLFSLKKYELCLGNVDGLEIDGVDTKDYPDFCDTFFCGGYWIHNGKELTDDELDILTQDNSDLLNELAFEHYM